MKKKHRPKIEVLPEPERKKIWDRFDQEAEREGRSIRFISGLNKSPRGGVVRSTKDLGGKIVKIKGIPRKKKEK